MISKEEVDISVYPNPTNGIIHLETNSSMDNFNLVLFNMNGNILYQQKVSGNKNSYQKEIDLSGFAKGVYFLQLSNASERYIKKVWSYSEKE